MVAKFKLRFNIKNYNIHGESGDVEVADLTKQRNDLIDLTSQYYIKDIYNMDETALFYHLLPTCILATEKPEGHKLNKERTNNLRFVCFSEWRNIKTNSYREVS